MWRSGNVRRGLTRLAIMSALAVALAVLLFVLGDSLIVSRRKQLFTVEIILYIVGANILSFLVFYAGYRAVRWVQRGFSDDDRDPRGGNGSSA